MAIRIRAEDLPAELKRREQATRRATRRATVLAAHRGRAHLVSKTPTDRGQMRNAWQVHKAPDGAVLANDAPYAGIIELGARPHPVSREGYEAIYGWVYRNRARFGFRVDSEDTGRGWQTAGRSGGSAWVEEPGLAAIARGIVWRIRKKGQRPTYFVRSSIPELTLFFREQLKLEIEKDARRRAKRGGKS